MREDGGERGGRDTGYIEDIQRVYRVCFEGLYRG